MSSTESIPSPRIRLGSRDERTTNPQRSKETLGDRPAQEDDRHSMGARFGDRLVAARASSTRSTRAASPTAMAMGWATCPGIIEHLDHLGPDGLGVDAIWLSPIYPVARHRRRLRRQRPHPGRPAVRHRGGVRPARRGGPPARIRVDPRPGHESHQRRSTLVRRLARRAGAGGRTPIGTLARPGRFDDRHGRPLPPNNWVSWFGGPAWTWEPRRGQFYHHTFLAEQPELDWRAPGWRPAQFDMVRGWLARGVDGFRLDTFNVLPEGPRDAVEPDGRGTDRVGSAGAPLRLRPAGFPAADRAVPGGRRRGSRAGCRSGSCSSARLEGAAALTTDRHLVFDWELLDATWSAAAIRAATIAAARRLRADRVADGRAVEPRPAPAASRLAASLGAGDADATASRTGRGRAAADAARDAVPVLRRGARDGRRATSRPRRASTRRRPGSGRTSHGGIDPGSNADAVDARWPGRRVHHGPAVAAARGRRETRNVAAQSGDPDSVLACYRRAARCAPGRSPSPAGWGARPRSIRMAPIVLAYRRRRAPGADVLVPAGLRRRRGHGPASCGRRGDPVAACLGRRGSCRDARSRRDGALWSRRIEADRRRPPKTG